MVPLTSLLLPILLSGVAVFVLSSLIHMVLPYHKSDYKPLPSEAQVLAAMRPFNIPVGDYMAPRASSMADMKSPEFLDKLNKGPVFTMTVMPGGQFTMASTFIQWFLYSLLVSTIAAYIAGEALGPGADKMRVLQFAGATAFASYSMAFWPMSIWYKRSWATTMKATFDGLLFGLATGGVFAWLWPV